MTMNVETIATAAATKKIAIQGLFRRGDQTLKNKDFGTRIKAAVERQG
jgi:hypothetical protein